ncbi:MAG: tRNA dihydrouridine synthase DusB [Pseudomonadota bacterium]
MQIGPYSIDGIAVLAPMAGVTDKPFRALCHRHGAATVTAEMVTADTSLYGSRKSVTRLDHSGEEQPRIAQIVGAEPALMADAARANVDYGAEVIDINMGCPAKKVCNKAAGSALLADEAQVARILDAVVAAVDVPVTLKIRTGTEPGRRNGVEIARIAEQAGIASLAVHGRTRADRFAGTAEFATVTRIRDAVSLPLVANGDIDSPERAMQVLDETGADAVMIGRAAQGNPWLFDAINHYVTTGEVRPAPDDTARCEALLWYLSELYCLYGEHRGVRIARKHIAWFCKDKPGSAQFRAYVNTLEDPEAQCEAVSAFFHDVVSWSAVSGSGARAVA